MSEAFEGVTLNALADRYYAKGDGTRKAISYLRLYEQRLGPRRELPLRILELGVSSGASLLLWRDYLPQAIIIGIDIDEMPTCLTDQDRVHFIQGSQDDPTVLDRAAQVAGGGFDLIIDDAAHIGFLTKRSFNYLFPRWLVSGGCYVIEDLGTAFLTEYPDGAPYTAPAWDDAVPGTTVFRSHQHGMIGVVKQLIDHTMQELITNTRSYLPIARITFETNIAFIDKARQAGAPVPGPLPVGGVELPVDGVAEQQFDHSAHETRHELLEMAKQFPMMVEKLTRLQDRVAELEQVTGRLFQRVEPLRRIWRAVTRRPPSSQRN